MTNTTHQGVAEQLTAMFERDQKMRLASIKNKFLESVDIENTKELRKIVTKHGWPTIPMVGTKPSRYAGILAIHSDNDLNAQSYFLKRMVAVIDNIDPIDFCYLTDRICVNKEEKQIYGTQVVLVDGFYQPFPIEDEKNVDKRRAYYNLPPLKDYIRQCNEQIPKFDTQ